MSSIENKRLFDLVRFMRSDLHRANLITLEEYTWLCSEAPMATCREGGSPSPRRLEDYDQLRAKYESDLAAMNQRLIDALKPVMDWYQSDEHPARDIFDVARDVVGDLQSDRADNLELRRVLETIRDTAIAMKDAYRVNRDSVLFAEGPERIRAAVSDALAGKRKN